METVSGRRVEQITKPEHINTPDSDERAVKVKLTKKEK